MTSRKETNLDFLETLKYKYSKTLQHIAEKLARGHLDISREGTLRVLHCRTNRVLSGEVAAHTGHGRLAGLLLHAGQGAVRVVTHVGKALWKHTAQVMHGCRFRDFSNPVELE